VDEAAIILQPKKVARHIQAAKIDIRKSAARMTNARLLSVDPAVLDTTRPIEKTSAVALKYFEPLFEHLQTHMPSMSTRELLELVNWGKWRVLWKPGTIFVRQHETPHVVGIVMDGLLACYTEDEVTSSRTFVNMIRKNELVGSEDFQLSMFSTARRTIEVPTLEAMKDITEDDNLSQMVSKSDKESQFKTGDSWAKLHDNGLKTIEDLGLEIDQDLVNKARQAAKERNEDEENGTQDRHKGKIPWYDEVPLLSRPTVMFVWESDDIKRLMDVDPRTKQAMSVMLGFDLSDKYQHSVNLGSRFCGIVTHASTDDGTDRPMCGTGEGIQKLRDIPTVQ
jgi:hypothetical protein